MRRNLTVLSSVAALLVAGVAVSDAPAAPLGEADCAALKSERDGEAGRKARADMAKGPAWAKANLAPARLEAIRRAIEVDENLLFRCPSERPPPEPVEARASPVVPAAPEARAAAGAVRPDAAAAAPPRDAVKPAARLPKPPKKQQQNAAAEGPSAGETGGSAPAAADKPARAAPKPKASDAYVPPAGAPQSVLKAPPGVAPGRQEQQ